MPENWEITMIPARPDGEMDLRAVNEVTINHLLQALIKQQRFNQHLLRRIQKLEGTTKISSWKEV